VQRYYDYFTTTTREERDFLGSYDPETGRYSLDSVRGSYVREVRLLDGSASRSPKQANGLDLIKIRRRPNFALRAVRCGSVGC
jgi:hypothetical protein